LPSSFSHRHHQIRAGTALPPRLLQSACGVASVAAGSGQGRATVPLTSFNAWRRVGHYRSPQTAPEGVEGGRERREGGKWEREGWVIWGEDARERKGHKDYLKNLKWWAVKEEVSQTLRWIFKRPPAKKIFSHAKSSARENKFIFTYNSLRGLFAKYVFTCGPLKKPYVKIEVDFCRHDQLRSICNLEEPSYRKIVRIIVNISNTKQIYYQTISNIKSNEANLVLWMLLFFSINLIKLK
jgi:hypothetical protein